MFRSGFDATEAMEAHISDLRAACICTSTTSGLQKKKKYTGMVGKGSLSGTILGGSNLIVMYGKFEGFPIGMLIDTPQKQTAGT